MIKKRPQWLLQLPRHPQHQQTAPTRAANTGASAPAWDPAQSLIPYNHYAATNMLLVTQPVSWVLQYLDQMYDCNISSSSAVAEANSVCFRFSRSLFWDTEAARQLPDSVSLVQMVPALTTITEEKRLKELAANYFDLVHFRAPLFSRSEFEEWAVPAHSSMATLRTKPLPGTAEMAICLSVWALGLLATSEEVALIQQRRQDEAALCFFPWALRIALQRAVWSFGPPESLLQTSRALVLVASCLAHLGWPLHQAQLLHMASRLVQRALGECPYKSCAPDLEQKLVRVFWVCFVWESDLLANLEIQRSGVDLLADRVSPVKSSDPSESDDMICFRAETEIRRLINRIHSVLYASSGPTCYFSFVPGSVPDPLLDMNIQAGLGPAPPADPGPDLPVDIGPGPPVDLGPPVDPDPDPSVGSEPDPNPGSDTSMDHKCAKLKRHLEEWLVSIPRHLRPLPHEIVAAHKQVGSSGNNSEPSSPDLVRRHRVLRVLYFAAKHLIYRRFVLRAAETIRVDSSSPSTDPNEAKAMSCINASVSYLTHVVPLLTHRSADLWSLYQGCLACLLTLLAASIYLPAYMHKVDLVALRDDVLASLNRWAESKSSFADMKMVLKRLPVQAARNARISSTGRH